MEESIDTKLGRLLEGGEQRTKALERIENAMNEDRKVNNKTRDVVLSQQTQMTMLGRLITLALLGVGALGAVRGFEWFDPR